MNIYAASSDDHFALAPQKAQFPTRFFLGQIAGREPVVFTLSQLSLGPGSGGNHRTPDEYFPVRPDLDLAPRKRLANGAARHVKRMIEGDERGGLGHSIALHHHKAEPVPELFDGWRQSPAARNEGPEFQAEGVMHTPESPPPFPRGDISRRRQLFGQSRMAGFKM